MINHKTVFLPFIFVAALHASPLYNVTVLPGNATAINNNGVVAGVLGNGHVYYDTAGVVTDVGSLGGTSYVGGINDSDEIVGFYSANGYYRAFIYNGSTMGDLGTFGGDYAEATAIDDSGYATGWADDPSDYYRGTYYKGPGQLNELGTLGGVHSAGEAINANAEIAGLSDNGAGNLHAFTESGGVLTDLGTLGGATSEAFGLNDSGVVVGESLTSGGLEHAFIYSGGSMTDLGTLGGNVSYADGINDAGVVVGWAKTAGGAQHAAVDFGNNTWVDLNSLLAPGSGITLQGASAINASGEIVAYDTSGNTYLLTATPEPSSWMLFGPGLAACLFLRGRRRSSLVMGARARL